MADNQRKLDIVVGTAYNGAGLRSATADVAKFRKELALPAMGPLSREDSMIEDVARRRVRAMEQASERARVGSRVDDLLFGGGGAVAAKKARFSADEQAVRDQMATRIKSMREAAVRTNVEAEATKRLFGEAEKVKGSFGTILEIIKKFGTSNGTDALVEKLAKLAPKIGFALAAVKAVSLVFQSLNFASDIRRHNDAKDLALQLQDEQKKNELADTISLGAGPAIKEYFNLGGYRDDKIALEELNRQQKVQDDAIARRQKRLEQDKSLATSSAADLETLRTQFAARGTTPERAAYLQTAAAQAAFNKSLSELDGGGKNIQEAQEKKAAMAKATLLSLFDSVKADGGRVKDLLDGVTASSKELVGAFKEEFAARQKLEGETRRTRLQAEGKNLEAEVDRIRSEAKAAAALEFNPGNRRAIQEKAAAEESALIRNLRREQLNEKRSYDQQLLQSDAEVNLRRMRLGGLNFAADKEELKKQYEERLFAIKDAIDRETDAVKKADLERRAGRLADAAKAEYDVGSAELAERRRQMFKPGAPGGVSGEIAGSFRGVVGDIDAQRDFVKANVDAAKTAAEKLKSIDQNMAALLAFLKGLGVVK